MGAGSHSRAASISSTSRRARCARCCSTARAIGAAKRPEGRLRVTLDAQAPAPDAGALSAELIDLDRALDKLSALDARLSDLVALRLFAGLEFAEIATLRGVSERTVLRDWRK